MKKLLIILVILILVLAIWSEASIFLPNIFSKLPFPSNNIVSQKVELVSEESVTINDVKKIGPSVVTVEEISNQQISSPFGFGPFQMFGMQEQQSQTPQVSAIGSGFIVSSDGLIVTSKHVVSDVGASYDIITSNNKKFKVQKIYRDPLNDIALLKIDTSENPTEKLTVANLGDSSNLQVGQFVVAIGTALGEFRNTVTTGVISGLGRSVSAGDQFQGYVENLNNVIQTDAAINPGNSGGPLANSTGLVIGINTAVAQNGQNIGFALPINIVKDSISNFNKTGQFNRPYLGVMYTTISKQDALLNSVAEGAYIRQVIPGSPADKAGIKQGDIITKFDGKVISEGHELSTVITSKKPGDNVKLSVFRDKKIIDLTANIGTAPNQ